MPDKGRASSLADSLIFRQTCQSNKDLCDSILFEVHGRHMWAAQPRIPFEHIEGLVKGAC
jgi:hypothetical protein